MSKKKSVSKKSNPSSPRSQRSKSTNFDSSVWTERPSITSDKDPFYKKVFLGMSALFLLLTVIMALGSGINGDDEYQDDYSEKLVNYYSTMGADTSALYIQKGNMHYYGGFFDTVTGFTNKALGLTPTDVGYHDVRHIFNAILGFLAMFFTALFAKEIAGWRAAILTLAFMFLSPRFLGHSLMNPKDIPFALGYIACIYYMTRMFKALPEFDWKLALGVTLGMALAISTRAGGFMLVGILGLYAGLDFLSKKGFGGLSDVKTIGTYAVHVICISIAGLLLAVLFWPYAMQAPFSNPFEALGAFEKLAVKIRVLFDGQNIMSDDTPWDYAIQWIWRTIPLFALLGFVGSLVFFRKLIKEYAPVPVFIALFAAVFPVFYVIYKDSILHDGWRHLTFVYPTLVVLAALFFLSLEKIFTENKNGKLALYAIVGLLVLEPAVFTARNTAFPYTYFNPIAGGISGAYGNYETDYWGVSVKQAIKWMEAEGILHEDMTEQITITSSFYYCVRAAIGNKYGDKVKLAYTRFNNRYENDWDYGIFPSRYIKGPHLKGGSWPNTRGVHTVSANGVPLLSVEKGGGPVFTGEASFKSKDYQSAAAAFEAETKQHPDNELAWMKLSMSYINLSNFAGAKDAAENMLKVAPENTSALFYRGIAAMNGGDVNAAEADFRKAIEIEEDFGTAYYYLALVLNAKKDISGALENVQKAVETSPRFKPAYELWAQLYDQQGDSQRAQQIRQAMSSF